MCKMLDCARERNKLDPQRMGEQIENFAFQCKEAWGIAEALEINKSDLPRNVVVLGMGGSAIGGEILKGYTEASRVCPMEVNRDYSLPNYVGPGTLVIASSYSGDTEETIAASEESMRRGAQVIAISTGGKLSTQCERAGHCVVKIPGGLSPRAALGYSFVPLLVLFQRLGLIDEQEGSFLEALKVLEGQDDRLSLDVPASENPAKQHALEVFERVPIIYGRCGWSGVAAKRWKGQINENAKHPAWVNIFPELDHNEIMGWEALPSSFDGKFHVFLLRDRVESDAMKRRIAITADIIKKKASAVTTINAEGESVLAQLFSLIHYGDYLSYYLALAKGVDPTPISSIDLLKRELAKVE